MNKKKIKDEVEFADILENADIYDDYHSLKENDVLKYDNNKKKEYDNDFR